MVNRVVTGAHYGLRDWLAQRVTALAMAVYVLALAGLWLLQPAFGYEDWVYLFSGSVMRTFSMLFLLGLFYHAWIGVRDIVMDYVKPAGIRLLIYVLVILALLLYSLWAMQILWGL